MKNIRNHSSRLFLIRLFHRKIMILFVRKSVVLIITILLIVFKNKERLLYLQENNHVVSIAHTK